MIQWVKKLSGCICIMTLLMHLIPDGRFAKYVRFYAGLFLFLIMIQPILEFFGDEGNLDRFLQLEFLKEEYYDLETAAEGLADLKNDQILEAFQNEIGRQISEIAEAYGLKVVSSEIGFGEDGFSIETIALDVASLDMETDSDLSDAVARTKNEIAGLYLISAAKIEVSYMNTDQESSEEGL